MRCTIILTVKSELAFKHNLRSACYARPRREIPEGELCFFQLLHNRIYDFVTPQPNFPPNDRFVESLKDDPFASDVATQRENRARHLRTHLFVLHSVIMRPRDCNERFELSAVWLRQKCQTECDVCLCGCYEIDPFVVCGSRDIISFISFPMCQHHCFT